MAISILPTAPVGNVAYLSHHHLQQAQRVALHTKAVNACSTAAHYLRTDSGSEAHNLANALRKLDEARAAIVRMQGGAV
jgi:hypothetical protein